MDKVTEALINLLIVIHNKTELVDFISDATIQDGIKIADFNDQLNALVDAIKESGK